MGRLAAQGDDRRTARGEEPERMCAVTRAKLGPSELIRFVRSPDGTIVPDVAHRLPGRGVWVALDRATVIEAARRNAFARSLKRQVTVPENLADQVEALLRRRVVEALSLANKAGLVVTGFTKVDVALGRGEIVMLLHSAEAAADGRAKLDRKLAAIARDRSRDAIIAEEHAAPESAANEARPTAVAAPDAAPGTEALGAETGAEVMVELTSAELSLALGRQNVVHAGMKAGGATTHFRTEAGRHERYRAHSRAEAARPPHMTSNTEQV